MRRLVLKSDPITNTSALCAGGQRSALCAARPRQKSKIVSGFGVYANTFTNAEAPRKKCSWQAGFAIRSRRRKEANFWLQTGSAC